MLLSRVIASRSFLCSRLATARAASTSTGIAPKLLPTDIPIDEERMPGYDAKNFYQVHPGIFFNNRYKILTKVGWGVSSTVWLAHDTQEYVLAQQNLILPTPNFNIGCGQNTPPTWP